MLLLLQPLVSPPQTWRSPSLPFLPRSKQFDPREDVQLAGLLVGSFAVARAAAAAAGVRLLPLPRLPLLADQGAGDSRCPGHAPRGGLERGYASRLCGRKGLVGKAAGWCGWRRKGGSTPPTAQFASHAGSCSLAPIRDLKRLHRCARARHGSRERNPIICQSVRVSGTASHPPSTAAAHAAKLLPHLRDSSGVPRERGWSVESARVRAAAAADQRLRGGHEARRDALLLIWAALRRSPGADAPLLLLRDRNAAAEMFVNETPRSWLRRSGNMMQPCRS